MSEKLSSFIYIIFESLRSVYLRWYTDTFYVDKGQNIFLILKVFSAMHFNAQFWIKMYFVLSSQSGKLRKTLDTFHI